MGRYGLYDNKENDDYLLDNSEIMIEIIKEMAKNLSLIVWGNFVIILLITVLILKIGERCQ